MPDGRESIAVRALQRVDEVPAAEWDACAGDDNPFVSHAFLSALEDSGSVGEETGWLPQHLAIEDAEGRLAACCPLYVKTHSWGEYVFDHGWAEAYERAGGHYYPKLQCAVPMTPVTGPRLLVRADAAAEDLKPYLGAAMTEVARRLQASSVHVTFAEEADCAVLEKLGFLRRQGYQFHWQNREFESFDAFLDTLTSRKRKAIRKERKAVAETGLTVRALSGDAIEPRHWAAFFRYYQATSDKRWGYPYLTRSFFPLLGERLGDRVVLVVAEDEAGRMIAGALNLRGRDALYGRNWGCEREVPFLHFEACYYQAIDYAIAHGLARVEAGAQGPHKVQRGYLPVATHSAHWIAEPNFERAVADFLVRERLQVEHTMAAYAADSPYKD